MNKIQSLKKFKIVNKEAVGIMEYNINPLIEDYMEIVSNALVRRLQDKTQVFPLDKNDFIRTRLTHSLEVSTIGQQLGIMINQSEFCNEKINDASLILQCAGLLHDLGNPPFGHFGEIVIRDWFKRELNNPNFSFKGHAISEVLSKREKEDLLNFEGNAETFRLLSKIKKNDNGNNLNVSFCILSTLIKYPVDSLHISPKDEDIKKHKLGYFLSEEAQMREIAEEVGVIINGCYGRHPLTYLLEAADDIAYATSDLEDAFKKKLFSIDELLQYFKTFGENKYFKEVVDFLEDRFKQNLDSPFAMFHEWVIEVKRRLMYTAVYSFSKNFIEIKNGTYKYDLFKGTFHEHTLHILKQAAYEFAFTSKDVAKLELAGKRIIDYLLDKFIYSIIHFDTDIKLSKTENKYASLISKDFINDYLKNKTIHDNYNLYLRLLMVLDYISSMTDSYIIGLFKELNGIE